MHALFTTMHSPSPWPLLCFCARYGKFDVMNQEHVRIFTYAFGDGDQSLMKQIACEKYARARARSYWI